MNKSIYSLILVPLLLGACTDRNSEATGTSAAPAADAASSAPAAPAVARVEVPQSKYMRAEPGELPSCEFAKVMVKWDTSTAPTPAAVVEIYAGNAQGEPGRFASGGAVGEAETGVWVKPGAIFFLRDKATGTELDRLVIGGPVCEG